MKALWDHKTLIVDTGTKWSSLLLIWVICTSMSVCLLSMTSLCLWSLVNDAKIADNVDAIGPGLVSWKTGDNEDGRFGVATGELIVVCVAGGGLLAATWNVRGCFWWYYNQYSGQWFSRLVDTFDQLSSRRWHSEWRRLFLLCRLAFCRWWCRRLILAVVFFFHSGPSCHTNITTAGNYHCVTCWSK